jgi:hypothetical protein
MKSVRPINRNLLKAITVLALICTALLLWLSARVPASVSSELRELSRADFKEIENATRRAMWKNAFPSKASFLVSPRLVWRLATSRIRKIEVFTAADVQVQVRSASGDMFYHVVKATRIDQSDWHVVSGGRMPQISVVSLNGSLVDEVLVHGGVGLFGGRLYTGPDEEYMNAILQHRVGGSGTSTLHSVAGSPFTGSFAGLGKLTYTNRPFFDPFATPASVAHAERPAFSETEFSAWLSNHPPALKLSP